MTNLHEKAIAPKPPAIRYCQSGAARHEYMAWLLPDVLEYKIANLVSELDAEVISVDEGRIRIQVGKKAWLRRYTAADFPVEVTIQLRHDTICPYGMTHVVADMRPLARATADHFESRCHQLVRSLRDYLAGEDLLSVGKRPMVQI